MRSWIVCLLLFVDLFVCSMLVCLYCLLIVVISLLSNFELFKITINVIFVVGQSVI